MSTTFLETPNSIANPPSNGASDVLYIATKRSWIGDVFLFLFFAGLAVAFCILGAGFVCAADQVLEKLFGSILFLGAILGGSALILSIPKRIAYLRDAEPKVILSDDAFCDHRTGVMVELMDIDSIRLERRTHKGHETSAELVMTMNAGEEHAFDLSQLELSSEEIASRITKNANLAPSKGYTTTPPEEIGPRGYLIGFGILSVRHCLADLPNVELAERQLACYWPVKRAMNGVISNKFTSRSKLVSASSRNVSDVRTSINGAISNRFTSPSWLASPGRKCILTSCNPRVKQITEYDRQVDVRTVG